MATHSFTQDHNKITLTEGQESAKISMVSAENADEFMEALGQIEKGERTVSGREPVFIVQEECVIVEIHRGNDGVEYGRHQYIAIDENDAKIGAAMGEFAGAVSQGKDVKKARDAVIAAGRARDGQNIS